MGQVTVGAVAVLTLLTGGPVTWLGWDRRPVWVTGPAIVALQLFWHVGLGHAATSGMAQEGHHGHAMLPASPGGAATWADVLPDAAGWAMVATHSLAAVAVLVAMARAEEAVGRLLEAALGRALRYLDGSRPRPVAVAVGSGLPVRWAPLGALSQVIALRPRRRGPPLAATA